MRKKTHHRAVEILMIDDSPSDVRLLQEAFEELKCDIHMQVASDGAQGLEMVLRAARSEGQWRPDLILLDLNLPKMNGHQVLEQLKTNPETRPIPIIVLTSSQAQTDVARAYDCHANAYLKKPSSLETLLIAAEDISNFWGRTAVLPSN